MRSAAIPRSRVLHAGQDVGLDRVPPRLRLACLMSLHERNANAELASLADAAGHDDLSAVGFDQVLTTASPKPEPPCSARRGVVELGEWGEDLS